MRSLAFLLLLLPAVAWGQNAQRLPAGAPCGSASPPAGASPPYMDANGNLCTSASASSGGGATTPVVTGALANNLVIKNAAGTLYSVYGSNLTGAGAAFLQVFNATAAPADGAVTPVVCVPFSGGVAQANYDALKPATFSTGITAVVSTATTCFTKTTGTATAFLSGLVQ